MITNILNEFLNNTDHSDINHIIAKYIKKNLNNIPNLKIDDIAKACFVSKGKISSFCKKIGYENYTALKEDCLKEQQAKSIITKKQVINLQKSYKTHLHDSLETIKVNLEKIDLEKINKLVNNLHDAKYIFLYGIGYSHLLCQYFQYECEILNKEVIVMDEKLNRNYQMPNNSLLIVMIVENVEIQDNQRLLRKVKMYPTKKWSISIDSVFQEIITGFDYHLTVPSQNTEIKDRKILIRYLLDVILGRYQYLYMIK
ncbi:MAG: MurR/RpiR family transcriptional regulator [Thomasclavelia sp.]